MRCSARIETGLSMKAETYQCPNCNGVLAYDIGRGRFACSHCGATFLEDDVTRSIPMGDAASDDRETEHVTTVEEFLNHAPWEASGANAAMSNVYSCPACGAHVVADRSAVTASCPYCGNNMLVSGIASAGNVPDKVLPFSVTHDEAMEHMRNHFTHKWYLSRRFRANLEHIQGVYVPYHLYDLRVTGWADYIGNHELSDSNGSKTEVSHIALHRKGRIDIWHMPVDASSKMPDNHMDAIAPFDFAKMRDFSTVYVAGFLAEVADESPQTCLPRAEDRARDDFREQLAADARNVDKVDSLDTIDEETNVEIVHVTQAALPVWLMHCTWEGNHMLFAVNGETGKCVGDLPIDKTRRTVTLVVGVLIALVIVAPLLKEMFTNDDMPDFMFMIAIVILGIPFFVDMYFKSQMRTASEAEVSSLDYSSDGLVVTESWNGPKFHLSNKKARADLKARKQS